jgi:[phosphatase 2A protein]-leucine-carboxy methyltransferase
MSSRNSPSIPNLNTLRGRGRGAALRGRARGGPASSRAGGEAARDDAVRATDQDAAGSRVSCVELGYLDDPYAAHFATQPSARRLPLLNRGTACPHRPPPRTVSHFPAGSYVRTSAIDTLVDAFLTTPTSAPKQIVSLGAGTDTRFFRLRAKYPGEHIIYHELDFPANTAAKLLSIQRSDKLQDALGDTHSDLGSPLTEYHRALGYNVHALDLRTLAAGAASLPALPNLSPTAPTLILSEMCLVYLQPEVVKDILHTLTTHYLAPATPASLVLYEPIRPHDAFGRTMIANLASRNIHLPTLTAYPELADQRARLRECGFVDGSRAADTAFIWRKWVSSGEKERVGRLEMLDELEELELLLRHYAVCWGWRDGQGESEDRDVFRTAWEAVSEVEGG